MSPALRNLRRMATLNSPKAPTTKGLFTSDDKGAIDALAQAQAIAFAPYVFQASVLLRDRGLLREIERCSRTGGGTTIEHLATFSGMSHYAVRVLVEAGLGIGLIFRNEEQLKLSKTGHFFLNDQMTRVNTDFMRDVCYDGAQDLEASLDEDRPAGLRHLNPEWKTIYPYISKLEPQVKQSWFAFDHFYSDNAFPVVLPILFERRPGKVLDIGGNTGKFILSTLRFDENVRMGMVDLPGQIATAQGNIAGAGFADRLDYYPTDILDPQSKLPEGYDIIWMSQFLDCFSDAEITDILTKCYAALPQHGRVFILETFWDRQKFAASAFSLQMISLYFTTMANGNSQMYDSAVFIKLIADAGFEVAKVHDNIGLGHTLLELKKP
jgi:hypothetical protein